MLTTASVRATSARCHHSDVSTGRRTRCVPRSRCDTTSKNCCVVARTSSITDSAPTTSLSPTCRSASTDSEWRFATSTIWYGYENLYFTTHTHTHTHTFNGPFSGTTQVSRHQRGKTNLDFTEARDSEWQWRQLCRMQVCTSLQTDNHASTPPLGFLQAGCPSCCPTNSVKSLKA